MRPTLHEIIDHPFFVQGTVPSYIPTSAHDSAPNFRHISRAASEANLRRLRRYSLLDEDQVTSIAVPRAPISATTSASSGLMPGPAKSMTSNIAQQEKEFQKAVQPGSPISALLSSARQPLLMGTTGAPAERNQENPLMRKLQAVKESPLRRVAMRGMNGILEEEGGPVGLGVGARVREQQEEEMRVRKKELESQKARIVAQMAPLREEEEDGKDRVVGRQREMERMADRENVPPVPRKDSMKGREMKVPAAGKENQMVPGRISCPSSRLPVSHSSRS